MPLYEFICQCGKTEDHLIRSLDEARSSVFQCRSCLSPMHYSPSCGGQGAVYFEEGRARTIWNLGEKPIEIRSAREHRDAMKRAGVTEAGSRRGEPGAWI